MKYFLSSNNFKLLETSKQKLTKKLPFVFDEILQLVVFVLEKYVTSLLCGLLAKSLSVETFSKQK